MQTSNLHYPTESVNRMKRIRKRFQVVVVNGLLFLGVATAHEGIDGVYMMPAEVSGFSGETMELSHGRFRYWFYSDVVSGKEPNYPLTGTYEVHSNAVVLLHRGIYATNRTIMAIQGHTVLWREDGLELWRKERRIHPYAILIRVPRESVDDPWSTRPSIDSLYDQQMVERENREYEERYSDQPEPLRSVLRAKTERGDSDLKAFKSEIQKVRLNLNAHILRQLISRMGYEDTVMAISAESILGHIYESDSLFPEAPPFAGSEEAFHKALGLLVNAMSEAKDACALTNVLILFLRVSKVGTIDLPVPEAGIRIRITAKPGGGYTINGDDRIPGSNKYPKDYKWENEIGTISQACQKWCRSQIENLKEAPNARSPSAHGFGGR